MRLDFGTIGSNDSLTNAKTHLGGLVLLRVLSLRFLVFVVLTLLPLLAVSLVMAEGW